MEDIVNCIFCSNRLKEKAMISEMRIPAGFELRISSEVEMDPSGELAAYEVFRISISDTAVIIVNREQLGQIDSRIRSILGMKPSTEPGLPRGGSISHAH